MIVPSEFPSWLLWSYYIPFHTYSWRSFIYIEFSGEDAIFYSVQLPTGIDVLKAYEINYVNVTTDIVTLLCYSIIIHLFSATILIFRYGFVCGCLWVPYNNFNW